MNTAFIAMCIVSFGSFIGGCVTLFFTAMVIRLYVLVCALGGRYNNTDAKTAIIIGTVYLLITVLLFWLSYTFFPFTVNITQDLKW